MAGHLSRPGSGSSRPVNDNTFVRCGATAEKREPRDGRRPPGPGKREWQILAGANMTPEYHQLSAKSADMTVHNWAGITRIRRPMRSGNPSR